MLAGCASLPSGAPTAREIVGEVKSAPEPQIASVKASMKFVSALNEIDRGDIGSGGLFGGDEAEDVALGPGDVLSITVIEQVSGGLFGSSDASAAQLGSNLATLPNIQIDANGMIEMPYLGTVKAAGLTEQALGRLLATELNKQTPSPNVMVERRVNLSNTVLVGGTAKTPGPVQLSPAGETLLDVVARAGGSVNPPSDTLVKVTRSAETRTVRLSQLQDRPQLNIRMRPDDIITLEYAPQNYTVLGAATSQATKPLPGSGTTLAEVIGQSGGLDDRRADSRGIFVLRHERPSTLKALGVRASADLARAERVPTIYQFDMGGLDGLFAAQAFRIKANDIVLIANAEGVGLDKALELFSGLLQPVSTTTSVARRL